MTGKDLKAWRKRWGLSQAALAKRLGVIRLTVTRWESGARPVPSFLPLALKGLEAELQKGGSHDTAAE